MSVPVENAAQKPFHLDFIDGIRALAALYIALAHSSYEPTNGLWDSAPFMYRTGFSYGRIAVDTFIVVSGFCLMLPIARRGDKMGSYLDYLKRRCRRILPPYYASVIVAILLTLFFSMGKTGTVWDVSLPFSWKRIALQFLLLHNLPFPPMLEARPLNHPVWSIAVEFQIYFFLPLILLTLKRWGNAATIFCVTVFGALIFYALPLSWHLTNWWFLALFTFGAIAARESVRRVGPLPGAYRWLMIAVWALILVAILLLGHKTVGRYRFFFDITAGVAASLLLMVTMADAEHKTSLLTRFLSWRPLVRVGLFSYSLYLVHAILLHAIYLLVHHFANPSPIKMFGILVLCFPLVVGGSYLFYLAFERPFLSASARDRAKTIVPPTPEPVSA